MKKDKILFLFVVKRLGFLKAMPLFALIFDSWLKLWMFVFRAEMLDWLDEIEAEILTWDGVSWRLHKYGGIQFDFHGHEIGHIHSNGIMDVLFTRQFKQELIKGGRIQDHHVSLKSGWVSFHIDSVQDKEYAKYLLALSYQKKWSVKLYSVSADKSIR